ncbi:MAG: ferritin-like domain-containing protein [Pseudomonadota bacterium]|nr:ferritin-like domain-containing protein [Pseudomonadota bacterium]MDP1903042.1 ferritin-like domain-containing protein [Pseudomonadota bacterium]MDP2353978.1 ferritin-like domain-containing protein [Pseudomonadota bacterium]
MSVDPRTLGWLSRALTHEMSAVQQYLAQSVLARLWGDEALAKHLRREASEELEHAERLMERLILLGVAPSAGNLPPARLGRGTQDLLAADRVLEVDAVRLYQEALAHAQRMRDPDTAALLESILGEELAHVRELDGMMNGQANHG